MAFQIKDDLFDYGNGDIGKPTGIDIKERKMTLPLIYAINNAQKADRKFLIKTVKNHHDDPKNVREVVEYVQNSGGIEYTRQCMLRYKDEAMEILSTFPDSESKNSLEALVNYTINRKK